jgi:hypothetical protein
LKGGDSMEIVKIKIVGQTAKSMFDILRNSGKISFANDVIGLKAKEILDGENRKVYLPNGTNHYTTEVEKGLYTQVKLEDGSVYKVEVDDELNSLIFNFNTTPDKLSGLRETVLSFIDYGYGKDKVFN